MVYIFRFLLARWRDVQEFVNHAKKQSTATTTRRQQKQFVKLRHFSAPPSAAAEYSAG